MPFTDTIYRSEDFGCKRLFARPEFPLHEHPVCFSRGCQLARKPLTPAMRLASRSVVPDALPEGHLILAFEPAS